jgi:hypothetical protein
MHMHAKLGHIRCALQPRLSYLSNGTVLLLLPYAATFAVSLTVSSSDSWLM